MRVGVNKMSPRLEQPLTTRSQVQRKCRKNFSCCVSLPTKSLYFTIRNENCVVSVRV